MNRRTLIATLGGLTASGALATGTGAFTFTSAERTVTARVTDDDQAVLSLRQRGSGYRSTGTGTPEQVTFSFPGLKERLDTPGLGLGTNSTYEFGRDSGKTSTSSDSPAETEGLLRIENQGTQPVTVYSQYNTPTELEIELYDVSDSSRTALRTDPVELGIGKSVDVGFRIRTFDIEIGEFNETLQIVAEAVDD